MQSKVNMKSSEPVLVDMEKWLESEHDDEETFIEYCERLTKNKTNNVIVNELILETDMYLQSDCIFAQSKDFIKQLVESASVSEAEFLKRYIVAFEDLYVVKGTGRKIDILQNSMLNNASDFVKDFYEHYKVLPIDELVERYKDQKFFKMTKCNTSETQKPL